MRVPASPPGRAASSCGCSTTTTQRFQPVGAVLAFAVVAIVDGLRPASFAFAGGGGLTLASSAAPGGAVESSACSLPSDAASVEVTDVLIAFDGSEPAGSAVRAAVALLPGARFVVLAVHPEPISVREAGAARVALPDDIVRQGVARLREASDAHGHAVAEAGVAVARSAGAVAVPVTVAAAGATWRAILDEADRLEVDLVACGTRGLGGFGRAVLGSVSSALVHHAERPVLVIPAEQGPRDGPLLLAYDGSEPARAATRAAARLFPGREAVVVYAWRSPARASLAGRALLAAPDATIREIARELDGHQEAIAAAVAQEGAALAADLGLDGRPELVPAPASDWSALAEAGERLGASVVIAGCRGRSAAAGVLLGSVSSALAHAAARPTLIVR